MRKSSRIENEPGLFIKSMRMQVVDDDTFMIGLHIMNHHTRVFFSQSIQKGFERDIAINFRLPPAKQVEIRSVDDVYFVYQER